MPLLASAQPRVRVNALTPPTLVTTTLSTTSVNLRWSAVPGATEYDVYRRANGSALVAIATVAANTNFFNNAVTANTTYYYQVVARSSSESVAGNVDIATTVAFTDDPITATTFVRAAHIDELRTAANYARKSAPPLAPATWTNATLAGRIIVTEDIEEVRAAINGARSTANMASFTFSDVPLVKTSTAIRKAHLKELRQALKGVQPGGVLTVSGAAVTEPYFSPNGDSVKDTTTVSAFISSADSSWTISIRNVAGAVVRTATGFGSAVSYVWDGRDGAGTLVADGSYTFAIEAVDGIYTASGATSAVTDRTAPTATLTAPATGATYSNVRQNGSTNVTATGTASDTNIVNWEVAHQRTGAGFVTFASGTSAVSNGQLGMWRSDPAANGSYAIRLQVHDRAGNVATATADITVAHFSASQNVYQINPSTGESVTYTSIVPFALTETLTIRNAAGVTVRTLVAVARSAGTYLDPWNGRNDSNALLPDGAYSYVVTVTEGSSGFTWDLSQEMRGSTATQYPYPECSARSMPVDTCANQAAANRQYDPYTNDPLKIHYSVAEPSRVSVVLSTTEETSTVCGGHVMCIVDQEYRAAGSYVETWAGIASTGFYVTAPFPHITVVRRTNTFPKNVLLLHGATPAVRASNLEITPPLYSPEAGSMTVELDLQTFGNAAASVTLQFVYQDYASTLRTVTVDNQSPGRFTYTWDGKGSSGHYVAPGEYSLVVLARAGGFTSTVNARFVVIY
jgi:flagellar hook assembly protein FlgD